MLGEPIGRREEEVLLIRPYRRGLWLGRRQALVVVWLGSGVEPGEHFVPLDRELGSRHDEPPC